MRAELLGHAARAPSASSADKHAEPNEAEKTLAAGHRHPQRVPPSREQATGKRMNQRAADSAGQPAVMAPSVAKTLAVDRNLLLAAAGRSPSDVAYVLMKQRAAAAARQEEAPKENATTQCSSQAAFSVMWSLQNQANIRGKWNIV